MMKREITVFGKEGDMQEDTKFVRIVTEDKEASSFSGAFFVNNMKFVSEVKNVFLLNEKIAHGYYYVSCFTQD